MPGRGLQGRFIAWPLIAILAAYCLAWAGTWIPTYYAIFRVWALVPAFAVVAVWIVVAIRNPAWRPRTVLAPAFAAALIAFAISTVTSRSPRLSTEYLALSILLTALYLILQRLMASAYFRPRMVSFATLSGIVIGLAYIAAIVPHWITWWGLIGHFAAPPLRPFFEGLTFGNPSAVMTASVLLAAPAVAHLGGGSRAAKVVAVAICALAVVVIIMSGSRAGWLAMAIATVIVGVMWLTAPARRASIAAAARSRTTWVVGIPALAVAGIAAVVLGPGLLLRAAAGGESLRTAYWTAALRMFQSSPLVGTGPGTWVPQRVTNTLPTDTDYYIPHAHDIYLQVLAEFGIVGEIAGIVVVIALARLLFGAIRDADPARRRMGWAALFATIYFGAHQLLDFYADAPAILFAYAIPIAWLDATAPAGTQLALPRLGWPNASDRRLGVVAGALGVLAIVASGAYLTWSERGAILMTEGTDLLNDHKPAQALGPLQEAVNLDPAMTPYHFALGLALADTGDMHGAEDQFSQVATADGLPEAWLDLAAVQARLGVGAAANDALTEALRLGIQQSGVALGAGIIQLQLGETDAAVESFVDVLLLNPTSAGDPWWTADPARAAIWPQVYRGAFTQASAYAQFEMAIETDDDAAATTAIGALDPESATTYRLVQQAWTGDADALTQLRARARERPLDLNLVNWCAILLRRNGQPDQAVDYEIWAETMFGEASNSGHEVRIKADQKRDRPAGINSLFYGQYTYRRAVPNHQLVDWLPELAYE